MASELYEERLKRIETAARLGVPDRVPVVVSLGFFPARYKGMKTSEYVWSGEKGVDLILETALELGVDGVYTAAPPHPAAMVGGVWANKVCLPGRQLGEDDLMQFEEREPTMTVEDYDFIIEHGWREFFPRLVERCLDFMSPSEAFSQVMEMGEVILKAVDKFKKNGLPVFVGGLGLTPFEVFSAARTMSEFFKDLRRYPQKVLDAMRAAVPDFIDMAISSARWSGINRIMFGGNREGASFISPEMYERFCHPIRKQMLDAFVDAGLDVVLHFDSDWTKNLRYFRDFPAGRVVLHTDGDTDLFKAKEILEGHMALMGDVHPTLLTLGTPEKVEAYCKRLIEGVGRGGGFILAQGCEVPINAKFENVKAMVEAAHKYGRYESH